MLSTHRTRLAWTRPPQRMIARGNIHRLANRIAVSPMALLAHPTLRRFHVKQIVANSPFPLQQETCYSYIWFIANRAADLCPFAATASIFAEATSASPCVSFVLTHPRAAPLSQERTDASLVAAPWTSPTATASNATPIWTAPRNTSNASAFTNTSNARLDCNGEPCKLAISVRRNLIINT